MNRRKFNLSCLAGVAAAFFKPALAGAEPETESDKIHTPLGCSVKCIAWENIERGQTVFVYPMAAHLYASAMYKELTHVVSVDGKGGAPRTQHRVFMGVAVDRVQIGQIFDVGIA